MGHQGGGRELTELSSLQICPHSSNEMAPIDTSRHGGNKVWHLSKTWHLNSSGCIYQHGKQWKLEQLERLYSVNTPHSPMITHNIDPFILDPKSKQDNSKLQIQRICQFLILKKTQKSVTTQQSGIPLTGWMDNFSMLKFAFSISSNITRLVQPIPPMCSQVNAWKLQIWLVSWSQIPAKMRKINRPWPKCKQLKR